MDGTRGPESDCQALQQDLASIYRQAEEVNMTFNSEKFECLRYWPKTYPRKNVCGLQMRIFMGLGLQGT
jgi:hypothetical protein